MNDDVTKKASTIVDIALKANVTNITVSRAFAHPELVKKETRERIYAIAKELDYKPNLFARSLKSNDSKIIGVVSDSTYNRVYADVIKRLCLESDKKGYSVMMFETNGNEEAEQRAINALVSYKASGIVLSVVNDSKHYNPAYLDIVKAQNIPLVLLDRDIYDKSLPGVFLNNVELGIKAGQYLSSLKDIESMIVISGPKDSMISINRLEGIKKVFDLSKIKYDVFYTSYNYDGARSDVYEYLKNLGYVPSIAVGLNGPMMLATIGASRRLGIHRSMRYFSFDEVPFAKDFGYSVPCVYNSADEWGDEITKLLFSLINSNNDFASFDRVYIYGKLII